MVFGQNFLGLHGVFIAFPASCQNPGKPVALFGVLTMGMCRMWNSVVCAEVGVEGAGLLILRLLVVLI